MKINQELVDKIVEAAKNTKYGLTEGLINKNRHLQIDNYNPSNTPEALALCLINGFDLKYDLVSILQAVIEILTTLNSEEKPTVETVVYRSSETGRFVAKNEADANPSQTQKETVRR